MSKSKQNADLKCSFQPKAVPENVSGLDAYSKAALIQYLSVLLMSSLKLLIAVDVFTLPCSFEWISVDRHHTWNLTDYNKHI